MKLRILIFEDEITIRKPICNFLSAKGYEVLGFPSPISCSLVSDDNSECSQGYSCADILITDMNMPKMSGLELVRIMAEKGCYIPPQNKIVISASISPEQKNEFISLGCHFLPKPFQLNDLLAVVKACEKNISPERDLVPISVLEDSHLMAAVMP